MNGIPNRHSKEGHDPEPTHPASSWHMRTRLKTRAREETPLSARRISPRAREVMLPVRDRRSRLTTGTALLAVAAAFALERFGGGSARAAILLIAAGLALTVLSLAASGRRKSFPFTGLSLFLLGLGVAAGASSGAGDIVLSAAVAVITAAAGAKLILG